MRSPAHLAGTLLVLVAVIVAAGFVLPVLFPDDDDGDSVIAPASNERSARERSDGPGGGSPTADGDGADTSQPTRLTSPLVTPSSTTADPAALTVAEQWVRAWADHSDGTTNAEWLNGLRPYTVPEYLAVMSTVDPSNVPSSRVTGAAEATSSFDKSVVAVVPTDGPRLRVTVVATESGWRVSRYERGE